MNNNVKPVADADKEVITAKSDGAGVRIHYGAGATGDEVITTLLMLTNFIFVNNATKIFNTESLIKEAFDSLMLQYMGMFAEQIVPDDTDDVTSAPIEE